MNYTSGKNLLSFLPAGSMLLGKTQLSLPGKRFQHQVTQNQIKGVPPVKKLSVSKSFGQPTHLTHPYKIQKDEIVPGIKKEEFKLRRDRLIENIITFSSHAGFGDKSLLVVIPSSYKKYMTEKIPYVFRQNSDFLYLTGCLEPDCILVITAHEKKTETVIFVRGKDPHSELWDGPRTGVDQAVDLFGVDKSLPLIEFEAFVQSFVKSNNDYMLWYDYISDIHPSIHRIMQQFLSQVCNKIWESPRPFIHRLRVFKSPAEQELMKKTCLIACDAIKNTIKDSQPNDNEAVLQARVDFDCRINGAEYLAYPPVIAGGDRANIIHYINNNQNIQDGELVLMDAGCEYHGYCSDITRTWPISGTFSPAQRTLYDVVYSVQSDLIQLCSKFPSLDQLYTAMNKLLQIKLKNSGVISNKVSDDDMPKCVHSLCPHHVSHYLGMDVHDTSSIPRHLPLEPGMVITVEPGIYVNSSNKFVNPEYHGIGIRIEDDILITHNGPDVLTASCPKHPDEIEKIKYNEKPQSPTFSETEQVQETKITECSVQNE